MCQFSGTVLQARQKSIEKQAEINLSGHFFLSCLEFRVASNFTAHLLHEYSPSLHLDDLKNPTKAIEGEKSAILAFYGGAQNAQVGQI